MADYKNFILWIWDENDIKHIEYTKQTNLDEVIKFCEMRGITKYCVFDDKFIHVATDGKRVLLGLG
jgi:hypothetical protein